MANRSETATELCPTCNDLFLDPVGDKAHRNVPFVSLTKTAKSGCSACGVLLEGILMWEDDIQDIKKVVLWSFGKSDPLNVNLWTADGLKQELEFYWAPENEGIKQVSLDDKPNGSPAWPIVGGARHISADSSSENCFELARNWLFNCIFSHKGCGGYEELSLPTRVLELFSDEYVTLFEPESYEKDHYAALSHCWGDVVPIRTTKANYEQMKEGILISELPKTFRDAIKIAETLHVSYLWIDSLCIIQDSEEDWAAEAEKMSDVYRNATFTIAAHGSADSNGGCFVAGASRQNRSSTIQCMNKAGVKTDIHIRLSGFREPSRDEGLAHIAKGNKNKPMPSRLSTRGWVFQERLLSQRTLHYTGSELVFECRAGLQCECRVGIDTSEHATNFKREFMEETDNAKGESFSSSSFLPRWLELVEHYTKLKLTKQSDRLPALSGLARTNWEDIYYASKTGTPAYLFGLWKASFHRDLHWRRSKRWSSGTACTHSRHEEKYAPSWSWASITGPVEYEKEVKENGFEQDRFFKLLEITAEPATKNKFGPGNGNFIAMSLMVPSKIIMTGPSGLPAYIIASTKALKGDRGCPYDFFDPDVTDVSEVSDHQECFLMITATVKDDQKPMGLVLVTYGDSYKRVGYLRGKEFTTREWKEGSELKTVKVI